MRNIPAAAFFSLILVLHAAGDELSFSSAPAASRKGSLVVITFALAEASDVEVAIVGSEGKVVRHLVAGVLGGKNAPPAPLKPGLSQRLTWDGKDDFGKPAKGGPFKVRVRAGTGVKFGRFVGGSPYLTGIRSMVADEEGNLYMQNGSHVRVYDSEGRYLREILPFAASVPGDSVPGIARHDEKTRSFHPSNRYTLFPRIYPMGGKLSHASLKNGVLFADARRIYRIDAGDGRVIGRSLGSHDLRGGVKKRGFPNCGRGGTYVVLSPDGKYAYMAGPFTMKIRHRHRKEPFSPDAPPGRIYRVKLDGKSIYEEFVTIKGTWNKEGQGGNYLKHMGYHDVYWGPRGPVQGLAFDPDGNLYVCDRENGRVVAFDENASELGSVTVKYAEQVAVHPRTRAIYVLQRDRTAYSKAHVVLFKFDKLGKDISPSARHKFSTKTRLPQLVLAAGKKRTLIWMTGVPGGVAVLQDTGDAFQPFESQFKPMKDVPHGYARISVDPANDDVYMQDGGHKAYRWNGKTGKGGVLQRDGKVFHTTDLTIGYDGLIYCQKAAGRKSYAQEYSGPLHRYTRDLAPAPYASGTHVISPYVYARYGHSLNCEKGMAVSPDGKLFISLMYNWARYAVGGFDASGKPIPGAYIRAPFAAGKKYKDLKSAVIGPLPAQNGGVRVDLEGNIYVGMRVLPAGHKVPDMFKKDRAYGWVGSVVRFGPKGGAVLGVKDSKSEMPEAPRIGLSGKLTAENATMVYDGIAPFSGGGYGSPSTGCVCRVPRFEVDRYGRVYMPNAVTTSVRIVDNNNNLIMAFGKYGNFDSAYVNPNTEEGKKGRPTVGVPAIPMAWPTGVGASDDHVYVLDTYNERVVRVDFTYRAESTCVVK